ENHHSSEAKVFEFRRAVSLNEFLFHARRPTCVITKSPNHKTENCGHTNARTDNERKHVRLSPVRTVMAINRYAAKQYRATQGHDPKEPLRHVPGSQPCTTR